MDATGNRVSANWRALYEAAVLELDREKLRLRILEAERAVLGRLQDLQRVNDGAESQELNNALNVLRDLRKMAGEDGQ